jgi:hypothetical protein
MSYASANVLRLTPPAPPKALGACRKTILFAWVVEIACVFIGFMVAAIIGFEASGGNLWAGLGAAAPFVGAAVVEGARIPLVRSFFAAKGWLPKTISILAILLAAILTIENLIFGFEHAFSLRIEEARQKSQAAQAAQDAYDHLNDTLNKQIEERADVAADLALLTEKEKREQDEAEKRNDRIAEANKQRIDTALARVKVADGTLAGLMDQQRRARAACGAPNCDINTLLQRQQKEISGPKKEAQDARRELNQATAASNSDAHAETKPDQELRSKETSREDHLDKLDALIASTRRERDAANTTLGEAKSAAASAVRISQMHDLARFFFPTQYKADETAAAQRTVVWFSVIAAIVLSTAGSTLAIMHYRTLSQPAAPQPNRLARALRGLALLHRRRKHPIIKQVEVVREVEVPVEKVVERKVEVPVEVPVEKIVERKVEVPVPIEKIVERKIEVPVPVDRIVEKKVEVIKPEIILVPVPLEASEAARRDIMERAARANGANGKAN